MSSIWSDIFRRSATEPDARAVLRRVPLFAGLNRREWTLVEHVLHRRRYEAGEVIFRQNEPGLGMYIVVKGSVEVVREGPVEKGERQPERVLATLEPGSFFGEIALLNETPRSATARARVPSLLMGLFQPDLLGLVQREARLGTKILLPLARITGQRLIRADSEILRQHETLARYAADRTAPVRPPILADSDGLTPLEDAPRALSASTPPSAAHDADPLAESNSDGHTAEPVPPGEARAVD